MPGYDLLFCNGKIRVYAAPIEGYRAVVVDNSAIWEYGKSPMEALGKLVNSLTIDWGWELLDPREV